MTWDVHKSVFQALKRTFMHVSSLPQPFSDFKKSQVIYKLVIFSKKIEKGKFWDVHKRAFQSLKRTLMHVSGLPLTYFDKKPITL